MDLNDQIEREAPGGATTTRESGGLRPRNCMGTGPHGCVPRTACKQGDLSEGTREQGDTLVERKEEIGAGSKEKIEGGAPPRGEKGSQRCTPGPAHAVACMWKDVTKGLASGWITESLQRGCCDAERKTREQGLLAHGQWLPCVRCVTCMRAGAAGETRWRTR